MKKPPAKHPSGLAWERWNWPFKTETERKLVGAYMKKKRSRERIAERQSLTDLGKPMF